MIAQENVALRPARTTDAGTIGHILYTFQDQTLWMPDLYAEVEMIAFCGKMIDRGWVTVAETSGQILGFLARDVDEICSFYIEPEYRGFGVGKMLLDAAKANQSHLRLNAFVANTRARAFYAREGFIEQGRGDGSTNEEGLPDVVLCWGETNAVQKSASRRVSEAV